jgi:hypothetical protein
MKEKDSVGQSMLDPRMACGVLFDETNLQLNL